MIVGLHVGPQLQPGQVEGVAINPGKRLGRAGALAAHPSGLGRAGGQMVGDELGFLGAEHASELRVLVDAKVLSLGPGQLRHVAAVEVAAAVVVIPAILARAARQRGARYLGGPHRRGGGDGLHGRGGIAGRGRDCGCRRRRLVSVADLADIVAALEAVGIVEQLVIRGVRAVWTLRQALLDTILCIAVRVGPGRVSRIGLAC
mgnify:CR=1 FL=1